MPLNPLTWVPAFSFPCAYGKGSALVDFARSRPRLCGNPPRFLAKWPAWSGLGDYAYGIEGQSGARVDKARLFCLEIKKGKKRWEKEGFGLGCVLLVENKLVILSDRGELVIADATHKFQELAGFKFSPEGELDSPLMPMAECTAEVAGENGLPEDGRRFHGHSE